MSLVKTNRGVYRTIAWHRNGAIATWQLIQYSTLPFALMASVSVQVSIARTEHTCDVGGASMLSLCRHGATTCCALAFLPTTRLGQILAVVYRLPAHSLTVPGIVLGLHRKIHSLRCRSVRLSGLLLRDREVTDRQIDLPEFCRDDLRSPV